jgi:tetratricopeptide (TPR) repeat protein
MNLYPPGAIIAGQYEVAGRPLMGGMGIVYLCLDHGNAKRPVALKTFKPEYLPDRAARDRFLREGTTWVNLGAHPHIVRCYQVIQPDVSLEVYLVLELVAKEQGREDASLRSWLTPGKPLAIDQALLFALQIARGMRHAADAIPGFVHRDLKPENVLVGADKLSNANVNRLRVTDFGLASVLQEANQQISKSAMNDSQSAIQNPMGRTQLTHGIVGTPLYMAPEQWKGEPVSAATDVYALGCILVEMLTGQRAVEGRSMEALQRAHCAGQVRGLPGSLPGDVRELAWCCLAVQPEARWNDWSEMEAALVAVYARACGQAAAEPEPAQAVGRAERVAAGWSYCNIGLSYLDIGKVDVARGYFEQAAEVGRAEGERALEGAVLGNLGNAYFQLGDARRAIGYCEQALAIAREIGNRHGEGNALGNLGNAYKDMGDARRAIGYYERQLVIAREIGSRRDEGAVLGNMGLIHVRLGDVRRAIRFHEQHLAVARETGDRHGECNALGNLGSAYAALGDMQRAIGYYEQELVIVREIGNRRGEGASLGNLGMACIQLGDARRAIGYCEQALAVLREIGDRMGEGAALGSLGSACLQMGDTQRAIGYYEQSLAIRREINDIRGVANTLFNMALLYNQQGERARALPLAQQAAQIFAQIGSPNAQVAQQLVAQLQGKSR